MQHSRAPNHNQTALHRSSSRMVVEDSKRSLCAHCKRSPDKHSLTAGGSKALNFAKPSVCNRLENEGGHARRKRARSPERIGLVGHALRERIIRTSRRVLDPASHLIHLERLETIPDAAIGMHEGNILFEARWNTNDMCARAQHARIEADRARDQYARLVIQRHRLKREQKKSLLLRGIGRLWTALTRSSQQ